MNKYTGHVDPNGVPARRGLAALTVTKLSVGPMDNNAYLLQSRATGSALLIDAANDAPRIIALLDGPSASSSPGTSPIPVEAIVTTHRHGDHWQALADVAAHTGAVTYAGADDAAEIPGDHRPLRHGEAVRFGDCELEVIGLRGHTPGSIALLYRDPDGGAHLFTGDSLFPGGPGRTTSPADFDSLMTDLEQRVFDRLPDETWVYPGHGDDTTLGAERPQVPEWRERGW